MAKKNHSKKVKNDRSEETKSSKRKRTKTDSPEAAAVREEIHEMQQERRRSKLLNDVIFGLIYVALGAFIFIAVSFQAAGQFGNALGDALKGIFGLVGLILPWYLIILGVLMIFHKASHFSWKSVCAGLTMLLQFCLLNSVRFIDPEHLDLLLAAFYKKGTTLDGGGFLGMTFGVLLVQAIGKAGLIIFASVVLVICVLLLFNTPISTGLERLQDHREERRIMKEREAEIRQAEEESRRRQEEEERMAAQREGRFDSPYGEDFFSDPSQSQRGTSGFWKRKSKRNTAELPPIGVTPFSESNIPASPFADPSLATGEAISVAEPGKKKSNILDFLKKNDPFHREVEEENSDVMEATIDKDQTKSPTLSLLEGIEEYDSFRGSDGDMETSSSSTQSAQDDFFEDLEPLSQDEIDQYSEKKPSKDTIARDAAGIAAGIASAQMSQQKPKKAYKKPSLDLLNLPVKTNDRSQADTLREKALLLEQTLQDFNVDAHVVQVTQGPAVTRYEIQPSAGVKVSKIVSLTDDIALNLRAKSIRIEAPIPGKAAVGIEIENEHINMVTLREIIDSSAFRDAKSKISFAVGKDIAGNQIVGDLKGMPHLLIAGSTGSGKSVCINSIIISMLYKASPDEVKMILIDPKVVELGNYNGIPHLLIPVVTDPSKAAAALSWAVVEMTNRYKLFAQENVRDLASYNNKIKNEQKDAEAMPQIVIVIDELSDLMMAAPSQVEDSIVRLAQMARAAGMHLIVATQRPSVDVITGLIKANIPSRIAFAVSSQFDSRTILDRNGAEHLVGKGDMLFNPLGQGTPLRVQGTFVSDEEVERVIEYAKSQVEDVDYDAEVIDSINNGVSSKGGLDDSADELLPDAIECVVNQGAASTSMLQRRFRIGYNRAARIVDEMEERGIVGPQDGSRPREVLLTQEEWIQMQNQQGE